MARIEAEAKARAEAEIKARMEAETRIRAEIEAKERAEQERRERIERETQARVEAEMRMQAEAEERIRREQAQPPAPQQPEPKAEPTDELASLLGALTLPEFGAKKPAEKPAEKPAAKPAEGMGGFKIDLSGINPALDQAAAGVSPTSSEDLERQRREQREREEAAARQKAQQEAAQREAAEREAARRRAEEERIRAAEVERARAEQEAAAWRAKVAEEEAKSKADEAARKMASEQAKAWEEAERRAKQQERVAAEQAAKEAAAPRQKKAVKVRKPSKPLPWGLIALVLVILAVGAAIGLPYVMPMQDYIPRVAQKLSEQFKQPVHIEGMSAASLPTPRLELRNVTVGANQEVKVGTVTINFDPLSLAAETRQITKLQLDNVELAAASFGGAAPWLQAVSADEHFPVSRVELQGVHVIGDVPTLPALSGGIDIDAKGHFTKARLASGDDKFAVTLQPQQGRLQLEINLKDTGVPSLAGIQFTRLDLTGELADNAVNFSTIDGRVYGGHLTGSGYLNWQSGWQLQGGVKMEGMELSTALPTIKVSGEMDGDASFSFRADRLNDLAASRHLEGTFTLKDGSFNNIDMAETVRAGRKQVAGGVTHFEALSGMLVVDASGEHVKQVRVSGGATTMTGAADATPDGRLSGQLLVDLSKVRAGMGTLPLKLTGTVDAPVWVVGR